MAARNAPSTLPIGFVKASVAVNATSIVPRSGSASRNSKPSVLAACGTGARPATASQNGPDLVGMSSARQKVKREHRDQEEHGDDGDERRPLRPQPRRRRLHVGHTAVRCKNRYVNG